MPGNRPDYDAIPHRTLFTGKYNDPVDFYATHLRRQYRHHIMPWYRDSCKCITMITSKCIDKWLTNPAEWIYEMSTTMETLLHQFILHSYLWIQESSWVTGWVNWDSRLLLGCRCHRAHGMPSVDWEHFPNWMRVKLSPNPDPPHWTCPRRATCQLTTRFVGDCRTQSMATNAFSRVVFLFTPRFCGITPVVFHHTWKGLTENKTCPAPNYCHISFLLIK